MKIMKINCKQCGTSNDSTKFYCSDCLSKLHQSNWTTNLYMGTERGKRTDIEFRETTMDDSIKQMKGL